MSTIRLITYSDTNHRHLKDALETADVPFLETSFDTIDLDAADAPPRLDEWVRAAGSSRFDLG